MTTPTDTAKLADVIEARAKKYQEAWDYIRAIPRDCQIPFDKMMELESAERAITRACMDNAPTIIAALRELEAVKAEVERVEKERDYAVRWGNTSLDSVKAVMWRYEDALRQIAKHATGGVGVNPESFVQIARAALGGAG